MSRYIQNQESALKDAARKLSESDKLWHIEVIAGNLSSKLLALANIYHQATRLSTFTQKDMIGLAYLLEDLSRDAKDCVTILRPGRPEDDDKDEE
jgi:hypothetical protein